MIVNHRGPKLRSRSGDRQGDDRSVRVSTNGDDVNDDGVE